MKTIINVVSLVVIAAVLAGVAGLHGTVAEGPEAPRPFATLPVGEPRAVAFEVHDGELETLTPREKADQYRDWLLFTVADAGGMTAEELNEATFDRPAVRAGFMRSVGSLEFGEVRSVYVGHGLVAALVPAGRSNAERADLLGEVADRHRKNVGEKPDSVAVFEYAFAADSQSAWLTRRPTVAKTALFGEESGYHESRIAGLHDFRAFMGRVDDVTYASMEGDTLLVLGGRKLRGRGYRGIRVEDVAAVWRSAGAETQQGSGFSLDPAYDFPRLAAFFDEHAAPFLRHEAREGRIPLDEGEIQDVGEALHARNLDPYFAMMDRLRSSGGERNAELAVALLGESQRAEFQAARYDGALRGTEAGMVLFYTDLVAKVWALNYGESTPHGSIPDFLAMTRRPLSPVYAEQIDSLNQTRLWFGPRDAGFQVGANGSLLLERTATRVYAASASGFTPDAEAPANAQSEAFLGWWNDHYDEIARFEPEYERLNQIMKWSLLVGWLNNSGPDALAFLGEVPVDTSAWFPEWLARHPELRFRRWDRITFYPRGYRGTDTEALPRLNSERYTLFGELRSLTGGVSLGGRQTIAARPRLSTDVSPLGRRPALGYSRLDDGAGRYFTPGGGPSYRLAALERGARSVVTSPSSRARFQGAHGQLKTNDVTRNLVKDGGGLRLSTRAGETPLGELRVSSTARGFRVAWQGRDLAQGQTLARRMSVGRNPGRVLLESPDVAEAYRLESGVFLVRLEGSRQWMRVARERVNTVDIPAGWDARVAQVGGRPQLVAWVDDATARAELANATTKQVLKQHGPRAPHPVAGGDYRAAALRARRDPAGFRSEGERHFREALEASDAHALAGRHPHALASLAELESVYRNRPEVVMRRALSDLRQGRPDAVAQVLRQATPAPILDRTRFFDEINERIRHASPEEAAALREVAVVMDRNHYTALRQVNGRLLPEADGRGLHLQTRNVHTTHLPDEAIQGAIDDIVGGDATLYVQDAPGLNNLDWSAGTLGRTLRQGITAGRGRLKLLPDGDLAHFQPGRIYATDTRTGYRLRSTRLPELRTYRPYSPNRQQCPEPVRLGEARENARRPVVLPTRPARPAAPARRARAVPDRPAAVDPREHRDGCGRVYVVTAG